MSQRTVKLSLGMLFIILVLFITGTCKTVIRDLQDPRSYFIVGTPEQQEELSELFTRLDNKIAEEPDSNYEGRYILMYHIIQNLYKAGYHDRLNLFLTTYAEKHIEDPNNAYYLLVVADNYLQQNAAPFAAHYYERILHNYNDLLVRGKSVHYLSLTNLLDLMDDPQRRLTYYRELLARFSETIDLGSTYYQLALTYEDLGEWELSIQAYKNFLQHSEAGTGLDDTREEVAAMIRFYEYRNKNWTMASLDDLVSTIRWAIYNKKTSTLNYYRAKVNFFAKSWENQENLMNAGEFTADFKGFFTYKTWASSELDKDSNSREAYLKTGEWNYYRIKYWYLYFRKIEFPADPEINGHWEWAGIYFGEKTFSGSENE